MRRLLSLVAVCALVAACGGGVGNAGDTGAPDASVAALPTGIGGNTGGRPSGAKVRVVNVYNDGSGSPASIDVYPEPWAVEGATPLLSVPYGTASEYFDPTVADEEGDMFLSFYRHGQTGNGTELISKTETLKGTEIITYVLMSDAEKAADGSPKLYLQPLFHETGEDYFGETPQPGNGVVLVNMHGISGIVSAPEGTTWFLGAGQGCKKAIGDDEFSFTAAGPGDGARYEFAPGDYSLSIYPKEPDTAPGCAANPLVSGVTVGVASDQATLFVVYAPSATDVKTMVLPLAK